MRTLRLTAFAIFALFWLTMPLSARESFAAERAEVARSLRVTADVVAFDCDHIGRNRSCTAEIRYEIDGRSYQRRAHLDYRLRGEVEDASTVTVLYTPGREHLARLEAQAVGNVVQQQYFAPAMFSLWVAVGLNLPVMFRSAARRGERPRWSWSRLGRRAAACVWPAIVGGLVAGATDSSVAGFVVGAGAAVFFVRATEKFPPQRRAGR